MNRTYTVETECGGGLWIAHASTRPEGDHAVTSVHASSAPCSSELVAAGKALQSCRRAAVEVEEGGTTP